MCRPLVEKTVKAHKTMVRNYRLQLIRKTKKRMKGKRVSEEKMVLLRKQLRKLQPLKPKMLFHINNNLKKKIMQTCMEIHCNPGCKNTIFEKGTDLSSSMIKVLEKKYTRKKQNDKDKKDLLQYIVEGKKKEKKALFGNRDNVITNDFYEKLNKKRIREMKKNGAISGCREKYYFKNGLNVLL
jgi:hypothetical protein